MSAFQNNEKNRAWVGPGQDFLTNANSAIFDPNLTGFNYTGAYRVQSIFDTAAPPSNNVDNSTVSGTAGVIWGNRTGSYRLFTVQNLSSTGLYLKLGTGASSASFNYVLKPGTVQDDGLGGIFSQDQWSGPVSVSGASVRYIAWKLEN